MPSKTLLESLSPVSNPIAIRFQKWIATGNDFFFIDQNKQSQAKQLLTPSRVQELCSRAHNSGGADGIVLYQYSEPGRKTMSIINCDGSEVEMCGNALRCLAKLLHSDFHSQEQEVVLATRTVALNSLAGTQAEVEMGELEAIGELATFARNEELESLMNSAGYLLSFGNPHLVFPLAEIPENWQELGERLQQPADRIFGTRGINVGFLSKEADSKGQHRLKVYERGVGATLACGSGACAASAVLESILKIAPPHAIEMDGGVLTISRKDSSFVLAGAAEKQFEGEWNLN